MTSDSATSIDSIAEIGYVAYGNSVGWLNYQGEKMPTWIDLLDTQRMAWVAATTEIIKVSAKPEHLAQSQEIKRVSSIPLIAGWRLVRPR